jgi:hypothetical protein
MVVSPGPGSRPGDAHCRRKGHQGEAPCACAVCEAHGAISGWKSSRC